MHEGTDRKIEYGAEEAPHQGSQEAARSFEPRKPTFLKKLSRASRVGALILGGIAGHDAVKMGLNEIEAVRVAQESAVSEKELRKIYRTIDVVDRIEQKTRYRQDNGVFVIKWSAEEKLEKIRASTNKERKVQDTENTPRVRTDLENLAKKILPESWGDDIASIQESLIAPKMPARYNMPGGLKKFGEVREITSEQEKVDIIFYDISGDNNTVIATSLVHEAAHANDWIADATMSLKERMDLLLAVTRRVQSPDRYQSSYVEKINNEDKELELYLKTTEYWAVIAGIFFTDPAALNIKDYEIVANFVHQKDKNFDRQAGLAAVQSFIHGASVKPMVPTTNRTQTPNKIPEL